MRKRSRLSFPGQAIDRDRIVVVTVVACRVPIIASASDLVALAHGRVRLIPIMVRSGGRLRISKLTPSLAPGDSISRYAFSKRDFSLNETAPIARRWRLDNYRKPASLPARSTSIAPNSTRRINE